LGGLCELFLQLWMIVNFGERAQRLANTTMSFYVKGIWDGKSDFGYFYEKCLMIFSE